MTITQLSSHPFKTDAKAQLAGEIAYKMLRKRVIGSHKKQIQTVAGWLSSHKQGEVKNLLEKMTKEPNIPVEAYGGGHRQNVRLSSFQDAMDFAEQCGASVEFISDPY